MMLIQTMIEATCKAADEYFAWGDAESLSPTVREAQSLRARIELIRLGQELLPVLPDPATVLRFLSALVEGSDPAVEELLWHDARAEMSRVHDEPHLARQPKVPVVFWSRKWGWQKHWLDAGRATGNR